MPLCHFYFASTPLHVFLSSAIALKAPNINHILLLIDQPETENNLYFTALGQWHESPFSEVQIFEGRIKCTLKKIQSRRRIFYQIKQLMIAYQPECLLTGNDRRIEFQYAMSIAGVSAKGVYIDEGTFTYVGREASSRIGDILIDNIAKKLVYGFFWRNPPTVGGSSWIQEIYVAFPDYIHPLLSHKRLLKFEQCWLEQPQMKDFSDKMFELQDYKPKHLSSLNALIILPHESLMYTEQAKRNWREALKKLLLKYDKVGVKYHPRDTHNDLLAVSKEYKIIEIPRKINFESLLSHISSECVLIGDFSTVLINARWLRPELVIYAVEGENDTQVEKFKSLYLKLKINFVGLEYFSGL